MGPLLILLAIPWLIIATIVCYYYYGKFHYSVPNGSYIEIRPKDEQDYQKILDMMPKGATGDGTVISYNLPDNQFTGFNSFARQSAGYFWKVVQPDGMVIPDDLNVSIAKGENFMDSDKLLFISTT